MGHPSTAIAVCLQDQATRVHRRITILPGVWQGCETSHRERVGQFTVDREDYGIELARGLSSAWEIARAEIGKAQRHQKEQYDKKAKPVQYREGARVMVYMPQETTTKDRKLALPYHGPYRILEVRSNCLLVRPVDKPSQEPILVSMDRVVQCADELPDVSWLGKKTRRARRRRN